MRVEGLLEYFCNINVLGFILYSVVLYNNYEIHNEAFSFAHVFPTRVFTRAFKGVFEARLDARLRAKRL